MNLFALGLVLSLMLGWSISTAWEDLGIGGHNPLGANWIATVFGLGFVLSFGY